MIIEDCKGSCGCTVPEWPKEAIKPGQSAAIKVKFDSTKKEKDQERQHWQIIPSEEDIAGMRKHKEKKISKRPNQQFPGNGGIPSRLKLGILKYS